MPADSTGYCYLCGANLGKTAMKNHILKFHGGDKGEQDCYLLKVEGSYKKEYWLYIDIPVEKTLSSIDSFLRKIWLECCGHLSAFFGSGRVEMGKGRKLGNLAVGDKFFHEYDFGSTTETDITIIENTTRKQQKDIVRLLARNAPPVFHCKDCGKQAEFIYMEPDDQYKLPFYCAECSENYDEFMLNPVTNSPRMGECGYNGELDTFAFDPASVAQKVTPQRPSLKRRKQK